MHHFQGIKSGYDMVSIESGYMNPLGNLISLAREKSFRGAGIQGPVLLPLSLPPILCLSFFVFSPRRFPLLFHPCIFFSKNRTAKEEMTAEARSSAR